MRWLYGKLIGAIDIVYHAMFRGVGDHSWVCRECIKIMWRED